MPKFYLKSAGMRPLCIGIVLCCACLFEASAQLRIALRADPGLSYNRVTVLSDSLQNFDPVVSALASFGLVFEFEPAERYHLLLSLSYQPRRLQFAYDRIPSKETAFIKREEYHRLQYLCLGAGLKLLTDDLFPRGRLMFAIEPALAIRIYQITAEEVNASDFEKFLVDRSTLADVFFRFATALEVDIGVQTSLFVGPFYETGLVNMFGKEKDLPRDADINIRNRRIGLTFGVKF